MIIFKKYSFFFLVVLCFFSCDNNSEIVYPIIYEFNSIDVEESKHFLVEAEGTIALSDESINPEFEQVLQEEVVFENISFPFEKITLLSDDKLSILSASFTTDTINTVLDYERISDSKISVDFNSIFNENIEFYSAENDNTIELCFHATAFTFIEASAVEYSSIDLDFCSTERNHYESLAENIRIQESLETSDTIFVNFTSMIFSRMD